MNQTKTVQEPDCRRFGRIKAKKENKSFSCRYKEHNNKKTVELPLPLKSLCRKNPLPLKIFEKRLSLDQKEKREENVQTFSYDFTSKKS
jgi:hypothetical protein